MDNVEDEPRKDLLFSGNESSTNKKKSYLELISAKVIIHNQITFKWILDWYSNNRIDKH